MITKRERLEAMVREWRQYADSHSGERASTYAYCSRMLFAALRGEPVPQSNVEPQAAPDAFLPCGEYDQVLADRRSRCARCFADGYPSCQCATEGAPQKPEGSMNCQCGHTKNAHAGGTSCHVIGCLCLSYTGQAR